MTEMIIFEASSGQIDVRLEKDNVWLSQAQLAQLFGRDRSVIGRHITAVFTEEELDEESNVQKMHIPPADKPTALYNLDVIISVGYRVKSQQGTRFRQWATGVLRAHIVQGYSLNEQRLREESAKLREMRQAVDLLTRRLTQPFVLSLSKDEWSDIRWA